MTYITQDTNREKNLFYYWTNDPANPNLPPINILKPWMSTRDGSSLCLTCVLTFIPSVVKETIHSERFFIKDLSLRAVNVSMATVWNIIAYSIIHLQISFQKHSHMTREPEIQSTFL